MQIGWIGLGNMGSVMAKRLLEAGHELVVYNRSRSKAEALATLGARIADTPVDAAKCAVVVTMLADDRALRDVLEHGGALAAMSPGTLHVSMSTISHALAQELTHAHAERELAFVGAPVFGRPDAAAQGKLFILAGGEPRSIERATPLFEALSQKVLQLGPEPASAHLTKVLGNFMLISSVEVLAEALNVARAANVDPQALLGALTGSVFSAPFYANYGRMIVAQQFDGPAAFALPLVKKDLDLARSAAASAGTSLPMTEPVREKVLRMLDAGGHKLDLTALGKWAR